MGLREELQKRIERKQQEVVELNLKIREANAYMQGLQDTIRLLPKDASAASPERTLRPGTAIAQARDAIKAAGKPLHITEILKAMGRTADKKNRLALTGSLAGYVRNEEVFTRPAPNTFGLIELNQNHQEATTEEPPATFGLVDEHEKEAVEEIGDDDVPF